MTNFNIRFTFRGRTRMACVHFSSNPPSCTVYFTDVDLVLEFGNKVHFFENGHMQLIKAQGATDVNLLQTAIRQEIKRPF